MEQTKIEIESSKKFLDPPLDARTLENAIYVDDADHALVESIVKVSGKYNREYKIVAFCVWLNDERVIVEDDLLIICLWSHVLVIDLKADKLVRNIHFDGYEMFHIFKFKSGYFIHGEGENRFLNKNFDLVWENSCADIFVNPYVEKVLEIFDDYVTVLDWDGYKHFYNETGEIRVILPAK